MVRSESLGYTFPASFSTNFDSSFLASFLPAIAKKLHAFKSDPQLSNPWVQFFSIFLSPSDLENSVFLPVFAPFLN
jgi:hypothetical protein